MVAVSGGRFGPVWSVLRRPLSDLDLDVLPFERRTWRHAQYLNRILDDPVALEHDAQLVRQLQWVRASRLPARSSRTIVRRAA